MSGTQPDGHVHLEADASGDARIYQAAGSQYIETHLYFGSGVERTRRVESDSVAEVCPYPTDMAAFLPDDAGWFFGRDRLIAELTSRLDQRWRHGGGPLVVVAPSGAGKSSLLQAGLIPKLEQGALPGAHRWPGLRMSPTDQPVTALAEAIAVVTGEPTDEVAQQIADDPDRCIESLRAALRGRQCEATSSSARLVLIVDQLEELFTMCSDERERHRFLDLISRLTDPGRAGQDPVALVVYGLRADFYAPCADYPQLRSAVQDGQVLVGPMSSAELREAILYPAQRAGLRVDEGLVDLLLRDLGVPVDGAADPALDRYEAGRLPLLAHALRATWVQRHGRTMTVDGYRLTGGIQGAVATTAEGVFKALNPTQQRAARSLFLRLVKIGDGTEDTRRRVSRADLLGGSADQQTMQAVVDAFTGDRLLTHGRETVEITHEVLLRAWPRLRDWITDDPAGNLVRQQLNEAAAAWEKEGCDTGALYRGARLESAREHASSQPGHDDVSPAAWEFLDASLRQERRGAQRRRRQLAALSVLTVLALIASVVATTAAVMAVQAGQNAAHQRDVAASGELVSESENSSTLPTLAKLKSLAAQGISPSPESRYAMLAAAAHPEYSLLPLTSGPTQAYQNQVYSVAFSPDGMTLATATDDGARLWDLATGRQIGNTLDSSSDVDSVAFSPDGKTLATATISSVRGWGLQLWNLATGHQIGNTFDRTNGINSVVFSPDGKTLATADSTEPGSSGGAQLWDVATGHQIGATLDNAMSVNSVAFSPDGKTLATAIIIPPDPGSGGGRAELWDLATDRQIGNPLVNSEPVDSVAFSPDGKALATGLGSGGAQLWDVATGHQIGTTFDNTSQVSLVAFSPDGRTFATASSVNPSVGGGVQLWDVATDQQIGTTLDNTSQVDSMAFSPDSKTLATADGHSGAQLWNLTTIDRQIGTTLDNSSQVTSVAFSPDGRTLATLAHSVTDTTGSVQLWDVATGHQVGATLDNASRGPMVFSPNGKTLAIGTGTGIGTSGAQLWDVATGHQIGTTFDNTSQVDAVAFSPDGKTLATGSSGDSGAQLWDVASGHQIGETLDKAGPTLDKSGQVGVVAFSPDGKTLATATFNDTGGGVQLWDVTTGHQIGNTLDSSSDVDSVAFSPDGKTLATATQTGSGPGDGGARLWNLTTGQQIGNTLDSSSQVDSVAFGPDGKTLATATSNISGGGGVQLWDVATGHQIGNTLDSSSDVDSVAFSPDGKTLATATANDLDPGHWGARLWNVGYLVDFQRELCTEVGGFLTPNFWAQYVPRGPAYRNICS